MTLSVLLGPVAVISIDIGGLTRAQNRAYNSLSLRVGKIFLVLSICSYVWSVVSWEDPERPLKNIDDVLSGLEAVLVSVILISAMHAFTRLRRATIAHGITWPSANKTIKCTWRLLLTIVVIAPFRDMLTSTDSLYHSIASKQLRQIITKKLIRSTRTSQSNSLSNHCTLFLITLCPLLELLGPCIRFLVIRILVLYNHRCSRSPHPIRFLVTLTPSWYSIRFLVALSPSSSPHTFLVL